MAPILQPKSLYSLCVDNTSKLVDQACTNIFLEHGCFGNADSMRGIADIQNYLVSQLPLTIFEDLSDDRNSQAQSHLWSKDARIKLAVFLHPVLTRFGVDSKGNELFQTPDDGLDEFFWCTQLRNLTNLTHLNLYLITTDEMLLTVGAACPKLEVVNIVSRIKQDISHEPGNRPHPGIALKFCVSDLGLRSLQKCQNLKRITMNKTINQSSAISYQGISLAGIQALVVSLPKLEFINFGSMGKALKLNPPKKHLKLNYISEMDPKFIDIKQLEVICPLIQHLNLSVPIVINSKGFVNSNVKVCNDIMAAMAVTTLPIKVVELQLFPFSDQFKLFLNKKGKHLEELLLRANGQLNSQHLRYIGECCPKLQKLHVKEVGLEDSPYNSNFKLLGQNLFSELTFLHISGRLWNHNAILPMFLSKAHKISQISLLNMSYRGPMDATMLKLLQHNKMLELTSLTLYNGCYLTMGVLRRLIFDCAKLKLLSFLQFDGFEMADVDALKQELESMNLDIKLQCLELVS